MDYRRVPLNESVDLLYVAKSYTSSLSDCSVAITKADGSAELSATTLSEVGTRGIYKTAHTFTVAGFYYAVTDSASTPLKNITTIEVTSDLSFSASTYCSVDDVRLLSDLTTDDVSDTSLTQIIDFAVYQINRDVCVEVLQEAVEHIDAYRENKINGTNATYYIPRSYTWYFGDRTNDGRVTIGDIEAWEYKSDDTRSQLTISSIDEIGKIVVSTAPVATSDVKLSYMYSPVSMSSPNQDPLIRLAAIYLSSAMAYSKVEARDLNKVKMGTLMVSKTPVGFDAYYSRYRDILRQLWYRIVEQTRGSDMDYSRALKYLGED